MQTACVIDFPITLKQSIKLALREARDLSKRNAMNNYIKQLLRLCETNEVKITRTLPNGRRIYKLQIMRNRDGELAYDILNPEAVSHDKDCPFCGRPFTSGATILYIHPGLRHDKVIFACDCGCFYAYYARKEEC